MARKTAEERAASRASRLEEINQAAFTNPGAVLSENVVKPSSSGGKVVVGCKLGIAYYDIYLCKQEEVYENTQTGPRLIKQYKPVLESTVRLRGTAYPRGTPPDGFPDKPVIVEGAALNFDVDEDFWNAWVEQNKLNPMVQNRMIYAHATIDGAKAIARELKDQQSGLEPINPKSKTDPRMPKSTNAAISNVETEESRARKLVAGAA
jgi:hypothetical protein